MDGTVVPSAVPCCHRDWGRFPVPSSGQRHLFIRRDLVKSQYKPTVAGTGRFGPHTMFIARAARSLRGAAGGAPRFTSLWSTRRSTGLRPILTDLHRRGQVCAKRRMVAERLAASSESHCRMVAVLYRTTHWAGDPAGGPLILNVPLGSVSPIARDL